MFASSFRILVTFAIVPEVCGISFFQLPWTAYGGSSLNQKITTSMLSMSSPSYIASLPVLLFCMGYSEETCWTCFDILTYASTTQKIVCSFELSHFSCLPTLVHQLIVKSSCALELIDAYYSCGPASHSILEWLGETNSSTSSISRIGSKQLYSADQNANPAFDSILPWSITVFMSGFSWGLHRLLWILDVVILLAIIIHPSVLCCRNRNADKWIVMCEFNTPSNLVAW